MLWSEIGSTPQIERSGMDGSKRKVVLSRDLSWPVSLTYDFLDNRVYWADEKLRCIGSTSLDGDNVKVNTHQHMKIIGGASKFQHHLHDVDCSLCLTRSSS